MKENIWLQEAKEKLRDAEAALASRRFSAACFWSQQAAELALKGVYVLRYQQAPPKVHDLILLAQKVNAPAFVTGVGTILNPAYTGTRYIDVIEKAPSQFYTHKDAQESVQKAREVLQWCESPSR